MKVTRLSRAAIAATAVAAGACAAVSSRLPTGFLRVRAPLLAAGVRESYPPQARPREPVQSAVFDRINADREKAGLLPVAWDERAAAVAQAFCAAQIRERTRGHYLTDGIPPYARTALAGIFGMQAENAASWQTTAQAFQRTMIDLALSAHADMMGERPPADGHRRTILDPDATHVGVGWAERLGNFRMAQEFLTRRLEELTLEKAAEGGGTVRIAGKVLAPDRLEFVTVAREPAPRRLTKAEADARTSYGYPTPQLGYVAEGRKSLRVVGAETEDRIRMARSGEFSFRLTPSLPGLWTILFYTARGREEPRPGGLAVLWIEAEESAR